MGVQAYKLQGALMWCSTAFPVLHMSTTWTVPESMAVPCEIHLNTHTRLKHIILSDNKHTCSAIPLILNLTNLCVSCWLDEDVFCLNVSVDILVLMDELQHVQLADEADRG